MSWCQPLRRASTKTGAMRRRVSFAESGRSKSFERHALDHLSLSGRPKGNGCAGVGQISNRRSEILRRPDSAAYRAISTGDPERERVPFVAL